MRKFLMIIFVAAAIIFTGCTDEKTPVHSEADSLLTPEGTTDFVITRPDISDKNETGSATALRKALLESTGVEFALGTDFYKPNNPAFVIPDREILIGRTNREVTSEFESLVPKSGDWLIARKGDKILILGDDSLPDAVDYFVSHYIDGGSVYVPDGELYVHTGEYVYDSITLGGVELSDCEVVYPGGDDPAKLCAERFCDALKNDYGIAPKLTSKPIVDAKKSGQIAFFTDSEADYFTNLCVSDGVTLSLSCGILSDLDGSLDLLLDWMEKNAVDGRLEINSGLKLEKTNERAEFMKIADEQFLAELDKKADEMKNAVLSSASEYTPKAGGSVYYFSADGDDSNDGLSAERPLKTLEKLKNLTLIPGDVVLFRRGDTFRGNITAKAGVTYSAFGEGDKPTICASKKNFADPLDWEKTEFENVWVCRESLATVGIILFDYSGEIGRYDETVGELRIAGKDGFTGAADLNRELQFWSDLEANRLYLYSEENPGEKWKSIEIGCQGNAIAVGGASDVTIDNLHITLTGSHGVGAGTCKGLTVRNCIFDWLGGSILKGFSGANVTRYGNAVEVYGGVDGYKVYNNWMYQIYDTGVTHQFNHTPSVATNTMNNVEYYDNLIEYCFWSIEYYNASDGEGKLRKTSNVYVHDNFCRFGGYGWGCAGRENGAPMYCLGSMADVTENYLTENNIFDRCTGYLVSTYGQDPDGAYKFSHNTYVQPLGAKLSNIAGGVQLFDGSASETLEKHLGEDDSLLYYIIDGE